MPCPAGALKPAPVTAVSSKRTWRQVRTVNWTGWNVVSNSGTEPNATDGVSSSTSGRSLWNQ